MGVLSLCLGVCIPGEGVVQDCPQTPPSLSGQATSPSKVRCVMSLKGFSQKQVGSYLQGEKCIGVFSANYLTIKFVPETSLHMVTEVKSNLRS